MIFSKKPVFTFSIKFYVADPPPKLRSGGAAIWAPELATRSTAKPRSLVPSGRKRNRPSIPVKPDGLVRTCCENRCGPCVFTRAATSAADALGRRIAAAIEPRSRIDARVVPQTGTEELQSFQRHAIRDQSLDDVGHRVAAIGNEQGVGPRRGLRDAAHRIGHRGLVVWVAFQRDDLTAAAVGDGLLERRLDHRAIGIIWNERREGMLPG